MVLQGHVQRGVVVLDPPGSLPDGTVVRVEVVNSHAVPTQDGGLRRTGGQLAGQIQIASDFDVWPDDLAEALGISP